MRVSYRGITTATGGEGQGFHQRLEGGVSRAFDGVPSCSWVRGQQPPRKGEEKPTGLGERESLRKQGTVWFGRDKGAGKTEETGTACPLGRHWPHLAVDI